tara:strand:+ start:2857 stop:3471 length:615 start_codon:yes stop_codon:yes gene_type:complete
MKDGIVFKDRHYCVIRNTLSKELLGFLTEYFSNKAEIYKTKRKYNFVNRYNLNEGTLNDPQAPGSYSIFGDIAGDMLLVKLKSLVEEKTNLKLIEQYSYTRAYKKETVLEKHTDRDSCEISVTLNIGCDKIWPIYLEVEKKQIEIKLGVGDLLIYKGSILPHWREKFEGETCIQTFLHYNNVNTTDVKFDHRPHLGLPHWFRGK